MSRPHEPKKTETVEVRLSHEAKLALMEKARAEGRSASDIIRGSIDSYLVDGTKEQPNMLIAAFKPLAVAGAAALAIVWSGLAPTPVSAGPDLRAAFDSFDSDRDGILTLEEFRQRHAGDRFIARSPAAEEHPAPFMIPLHHSAAPPLAGTSTVPDELLKAEFAKQDRDRSGSIKFDEFKSFHVAMMDVAFANLDRDGDGAVNSAELAAVTAQLPAGAPHPNFAELDSNKDGKLDSSEFFAHHP